MSDFGTARISPGLPATPLGKEHDLPGNTTIECPFCDWRVRLMDQVARQTLWTHIFEDCLEFRAVYERYAAR